MLRVLLFSNDFHFETYAAACSLPRPMKMKTVNTSKKSEYLATSFIHWSKSNVSSSDFEKSPVEYSRILVTDSLIPTRFRKFFFSVSDLLTLAVFSLESPGLTTSTARSG